MFNYDWDFSFLGPYTDAFLRGILITLYISVLSFILGTLFGVLFGFILTRLPKKVQTIFLIINDCIRAIPMLVLLFLVYYFPLNSAVGLKPPNATISAIVALGISQLAYTADIVRSAVLNVSDRIINAARALGFKESQTRRYIITPDVLRQILPAEIAFFIGIIRLSSLAAIIGCQEIVFVARSATAGNFRSVEAWVLVGIIYIVIVVPITILLRRLEKSKWIKRRW